MLVSLNIIVKHPLVELNHFQDTTHHLQWDHNFIYNKYLHSIVKAMSTDLIQTSFHHQTIKKDIVEFPISCHTFEITIRYSVILLQDTNYEW